jgi:hypothetical protein
MSPAHTLLHRVEIRMHTFRIVRERSGWTVQLGCAMKAPCRSRAMAIQQAERMAAAIRRHGEDVAIVVEPPASIDTPPPQAAAARVRASRLVLRAK